MWLQIRLARGEVTRIVLDVKRALTFAQLNKTRVGITDHAQSSYLLQR